MRVALALLVGVQVASVARVSAQPAPPPSDGAAQADVLAAEAAGLASGGKFVEAAAKFRAAHAADPRPDLLCNVGVAYHKAKDLPRAQLYLGQCMIRAGSLDAGFVTAVRDVLGAAEAKLREGEFAPVTIAVRPDAAVISVSAFSPDETLIGSSLVWLPFGTHTITVTAEGHLDWQETIKVEDRSDARVQISLDRRPVTDGGTAPVVYGPPRSRKPAIIATIATGAFGVAAIATYFVARSHANKAGAPGLTQDEYNDRVSKARKFQHLSWGFAGAAGLGAIVSGYLWYRATRPRSTAVEVRPTSDGAAVWLTGSF